MTSVEKNLEERMGTGPRLECHPMSPIDSQALESVSAAFQSRTSCVLGQAWQSELCPAFSPASVQVAYAGRVLLVYAVLRDVDIHTNASGANQRLWELGDVFEIFLGEEAEEGYVELQVAPNNHRLQLRYTDRAAFERARERGISEFILPSDSFSSNVWIKDNQWHVLAGIPATLVNPDIARLTGRCWRFSFGRYDYTRGQEAPVISSSSRHAKVDFHSKQEWGYLDFKAA